MAEGVRLHDDELLTSWIIESFESLSEPDPAIVCGSPKASMADVAGSMEPPINGAAPPLSLGLDRETNRFLDQVEAWLHGRSDALDLIERLRDRVAFQASLPEQGEPETLDDAEIAESAGDGDQGPDPDPALAVDPSKRAEDDG